MSEDLSVPVYFSGDGRPEHLGVLDEHGGATFRSVCGETTTQEAKATLPGEVAGFTCPSCDEQYKMWREVKGL